MFESLGKAIRKLLDRKLRNTAVAIPGIVVSYNASSKTAKIQPGVYRVVPNADDEDTDSYEEMPPIPGVPVMWPRARGFVMEGSLNPGDSVLLIACDRDIAGWRRTGRLSAPSDGREHHWANAVALPGLVPSQNPFPVPTDAAALNSVVMSNLNELKAKLDNLVTKFNLHTHATAGTGIPSPPGPMPAGTPYIAPPGVGPTNPPDTTSSMSDASSTLLKLSN